MPTRHGMAHKEAEDVSIKASSCWRWVRRGPWLPLWAVWESAGRVCALILSCHGPRYSVASRAKKAD